MKQILIHILYNISNILLIPVVIGLLLLLAWAVMLLGGIVSEYIERRKNRLVLRDYIDKIMKSDELSKNHIFDEPLDKGKFSGFMESFFYSLKEVPIDRLNLAKIIDDIEIKAMGKTTRGALGIRLGPILGLMGTLIPLGPALAALASGNISDLSNYLIIAFTSTIIGLLIGGICYTITQIRNSWYAQDISDLKFIYESYFCGEENVRENKQKQ